MGVARIADVRHFLTFAGSYVLVLFMIAAQPIRETAEAAEERAERHLGMLRELAEIGMGLARKLQHEADQADTVPAELVLTFSRLARAVRQTMALETRLADDRLVRRGKVEADERAERFTRGRANKAAVKDIVERIIDAGDGDTERLLDDLDERLDDPRDDAHFADRPLGDLVAAICRDLGVTLDWSLFEGQDWAVSADPAAPPDVPRQTPSPTSCHPGTGAARVRDP
jgi:hypothetical protein